MTSTGMMPTILLVVLVGTLFAADPLEEVKSMFFYHDTPIHPGILQLFDPGLADLNPQVLSVDLSAAQPSNRFPSDNYVAEPSGWVRPKNSDTEDRSGFSYRFVGRLPSGALVVETVDAGGGSGSFENVMIFSVRAETGLNDDGSSKVQHVLHLLRETGLGDRAEAVLQIKGAHVMIDRSQAKDPEMRSPLVIDDPLHAANAAGTAQP